MTLSEFRIEFDILYNNITSNLSPGLNDYEISVFLTKAQEQIVKNYFSIKGNPKQEGLNNSVKRDSDFSTLFKTVSLNNGIVKDPNPINILNKNINRFTFNNDYLFIINEICEIEKVNNLGEILDTLTTVVVPLHYLEFSRLMTGPYNEPYLYQSWRLISDETLPNTSTFDIIIRYGWEIKNYIIRYIKKPNPIILDDLDNGLSIDGKTDASECELNSILHSEILNRAVELAKVAFLGEVKDSIALNQRGE